MTNLPAPVARHDHSPELVAAELDGEDLQVEARNGQRTTMHAIVGCLVAFTVALSACGDNSASKARVIQPKGPAPTEAPSGGKVHHLQVVTIRTRRAEYGSSKRACRLLGGQHASPTRTVRLAPSERLLRHGPKGPRLSQPGGPPPSLAAWLALLRSERPIS